MIISNNKHANQKDFEAILKKITEVLNQDAIRRPEYYKSRSGTKLEEDVYTLLVKASKGTIFENTIEIVSGQKFPDIVANGYYGVEVKTTKTNSWTSTGSSIVESTRVESVEKIYMLFGKLSTPIKFKTKPYESCLSDIVVTHSPRYKIDMELGENETIFEKMNVPYDVFRKVQNSINIVKDYYKKILQPGQNLWWIDSEPIDEQAVSPIVKMWNTLSVEEKRKIQIKGFCWFPEIFGNSTNKYNRFALWLVTQKGVVVTSLRDIFTAGGRMDIITEKNNWDKQPQILYKMAELKEEIRDEISNATIEWINEFWDTDVKDITKEDKRIKIWIDLVINQINDNKQETKIMLYDIFQL